MQLENSAIRRSEIENAALALGLDAADRAALMDTISQLLLVDIEGTGKAARVLEVFPFVLSVPSAALFDYQREVVESVKGMCGRPGAVLLSLPTGAGKTRTALTLALELLRDGLTDSVTWLAPSTELVAQAISTVRDLWKQVPASRPVVCSDLFDRSNSGAHLRFGTVQSAVKRAPLFDQVARGLLVFDEAHQAAARTYQRVVRGAISRGCFVVGLSATPGRSTEGETDALVRLFGGNLIVPASLGRNPIDALRNSGVLSTPQLVPISDAMINGRVDLARLTEAMGEAGRSPGFVFASSIAECYVIAGLLRNAGLRADVVSHHQSFGVRAEKLAMLRAGELDWLVNVELLATGIDIPSLRSVVLLSEIQSPILFEQIIGRVSRGPAVGGLSSTFVFDFHNHFHRFGGVSSYARFVATSW